MRCEKFISVALNISITTKKRKKNLNLLWTMVVEKRDLTLSFPFLLKSKSSLSLLLIYHCYLLLQVTDIWCRRKDIFPAMETSSAHNMEQPPDQYFSTSSFSIITIRLMFLNLNQMNSGTWGPHNWKLLKNAALDVSVCYDYGNVIIQYTFPVVWLEEDKNIFKSFIYIIMELLWGAI